jgi:hypothetical protein
VSRCLRYSDLGITQIRSGKKSQHGVDMDYYLVQLYSLGLSYVSQAWSDAERLAFPDLPILLVVEITSTQSPIYGFRMSPHSQSIGANDRSNGC